MSEVNADGTLVNPEDLLLRLACRRANVSVTAVSPHTGAMSRTVRAANGLPAGQVGGAPHLPVPPATS